MAVDPEAARAYAGPSRRDGAQRADRGPPRPANLRATPLQDLGLVLALQELAETAAERAGAQLDLDFPDQIAGSLPHVVEQGVYRIAQETLENMVRHAQASAITVRLEQDSSGLELTIEDDGQGTDPAPGTPHSRRIAWACAGCRSGPASSGPVAHHKPAGRGYQVHLTVPL